MMWRASFEIFLGHASYDVLTAAKRVRPALSR